jgi:hypothetical protein
LKIKKQPFLPFNFLLGLPPAQMIEIRQCRRYSERSRRGRISTLFTFAFLLLPCFVSSSPPTKQRQQSLQKLLLQTCRGFLGESFGPACKYCYSRADGFIHSRISRAKNG